MGLAAKKMEASFGGKRMPEVLKELEATTKGATKGLVVEFDWKSFGEDEEALNNISNCWEHTLQGVEKVCEDEVGRTAVKKGLKKIKIVNMQEDKDAKLDFKNGTLTLEMHFAGGPPSGPGWVDVQKFLEKNLD